MSSARVTQKVFYAVTIFFAAVIVALFFAVGINSKNAESVAISYGRAEPFNEGWYYFDKQNGKTMITLPARIPANKNGEAVIFKQIENADKDKKYKDDLYLDLITHHQSIKVSFGIKMLYEYKPKTRLKWLKTYRAFHHLVKIPPYEVGTIAVEVKAGIHRTAGEFREIYIGSKNEIITSILFRRLDHLLLGAVLIITAIAFALSTKIYSKIDNDITIVHLTIMLLLIGTWQLEESGVTQIFVGSQAFHWFFEYPFQFFIVFDTFFLVQDFARKKDSIALKAVFAVGVVISGAQIVMQVLGITQFTNTIYANFLPYILDAILLLYYVNTYDEFKSKWGTVVFNISTSLVIMAFGVALVMKNRFKYSNHFLNFAIVFVFITLAVIVYQKTFARMEKFRTSQLYRKLAFIDMATGVSSKTAWYKLTEEFDPSKNNFKNCCLIMFDMNNLKKINDRYGHLAGDKVINAFCGCLVETVGLIGEIFRIGGDEFICFCNNTTKEHVDELLKKFDSAAEAQKESEIPFTAAYGCAFFTPKSHDDFAAAQTLADENMYQNKKEKKAAMSPTN